MSALAGINPYAPSGLPGGIPTGQIGFEAAISDSLQSGMGDIRSSASNAMSAIRNNIDEGMRRDSAITRRGIGDFNAYADAGAAGYSPYVNAGAGASGLQAALSGAMGPEAQAQAYQNFISSPGQDWLRSRGERAVLRNSAALGGLGGGNVRKALMDYGIGSAAQDFDASFNRLGAVSDRGLSAVNALGGLRMNQGSANLSALEGLGSRRFQGGITRGQNLAELMANAGYQTAGMREGAGSAIAGTRYQTGQGISNAVANTTQQLAQNQSGDILAQLLGGAGGDLSNLIVQAQSGDAQAKENLAALLANIATGSASSLGGLQGVPGIQETQGGVNRFLSSLPGISA